MMHVASGVKPAGRRILSGILSMVMVVGLMLPLDRSAAHAAVNPVTQKLADGLASLQQVIAAASALEELAEAVPFTGIAPALSDGVDVLQSLADTLGTLNSVGSQFVEQAPGEVGQYLEDLDAVVDGVAVTFGCDGGCDPGETPVSVGETGDLVSITLPIRLTRTVSTPLVFESDVIDISGDSLTVDLSASTTLQLTFNTATAITQPQQSLSVAPFTVAFGASLTGGPITAQTRLGVADATATLNNLAVTLGLSMPFTDPDGGGAITFEEWANTTVADLATVSRTGSVAGNVSFDTDLIAGSPDAGPFDIGDPDLSDGYSFTLPSLGDLDPFSLISPEALVAAIGQAAAALGGGQAATDIDIPFLDGTVRRLAQASRPILDVVDSLGVICGTENGVTPAGSVEDLATGTDVYCQGVVSTGVKPGSIVWTSDVASEGDNTSGAAADGTLALGATKNAKFTMTENGDFTVSVKYTATFDDDNDGTVDREVPNRTSTQPPRSVQGLVAVLDQLGDFDLDPSQILGFDNTTKALTFHLKKTFDPPSVDLPLSIGDQLESATGIVGLQSVGGGITADASGVAIDITPGVLLLPPAQWGTVTGPGGCPDPSNPDPCTSALDLFFVKVNPSGPEFAVGNASFTLNAPKLVGQLGYLGISADTGAFTLQKSNPANPVLAVNLTPAGNMTVDGVVLPDAIRLRELLFKLTDRASASNLNLKLDGSLTVKASLNGNAIGQAGVTFTWDPVLVGQPTINADADIAGFFANFNPVPNLFGTHTGAGNAAVLTNNAANFSNTAIGARLENLSDNSSCEVTSATATTLTCTLAGGTENDWDTGDLYRLRVGSPLAMLEVLLDNLDQIIGAIDNVSGGAVGDALDTKLPVVGVKPRELLAQLQQLRRTMAEIRGTGANVRCGTTDTTPVPTGDPSKITIANGATATIYCNAYNPKGASSAAWGTPTVLETPGVSAAVTANANNAATAGATPTANAAITFTNNSGSTVELFQRSQRVNDDGTISTVGYQIPVTFDDIDGPHAQEYPSLAQPTTIQALEDAIKDKLGIEEGFDLDFDESSLPGTKLVTLDIGVGRCNDAALCPGAANMPALSTPINVSVAGLGDLVSASSAGDVAASYNTDVRLKLGFDLGDSPEVYVMPGTGIDLEGRFTGDGLDFQASLGPVRIAAGQGARAASDGGTPDDPDDDTPPGVGILRLGAGLSIGDAIAAPVTIGDFLGNVGTHLAPSFSAGSDTDCGSITTNDGGTPDDPDDDTVVQLSGPGVLGCTALSVGLVVGNTPPAYVGDLGLKVTLSGGSFQIEPVIPDNLLANLLAQALDLRLLLKALPEIIGTVEAGLRATAASAAGNGKLPLVGDALDAGADVAGKLREVAQAIVDAIPQAVWDADNANSALVAALQQFIFDSLHGTGLLVTGKGDPVDDPTDIVVLTDCGGGYGSCTDANSLLDLVDVRAIFGIGQNATESLPFDLGLDGVPLRLVGAVAPEVEWYFVIDLGLNKETGPYVGVKDPGGNTRSDTELNLGAGIGLGQNAAACNAVIADPVAPLNQLITGDYTGDRCLGGQLAFLAVQVRDSNDNPSEVGLTVGLDLSNGTEDKLGFNNAGDLKLQPTIGLDANLDVRFRTGIVGGQEAGFPEVVGTFALDWGWSIGQSVTAPDVGFDNIHLNLKPLLDSFITPVSNEVRRITGPFKPVIDTLTAPVPVVSDLAELVGQPPVTLLSLMEVISGNDLSLIQTIAAFIKFINDSPLGDGYYPLGGNNAGSFDINSAGARKAQGPTEAAKLIENGVAAASSLLGVNTVLGDGSAVQAKAASAPPPTKANLPGTFGVPGLTFPFLDNPSQIFGLLMGQDITLVRFDVGPLQASAGFQYNFPPIMVGPVPIGIGVGGSVTVKGRFVIGYDTSGLRKVLDGGSGTHLFDGIFLDDLDLAGVDVPEISFIGEVYAQAGVTVGIASAGIVAGLRITVDLNLDDSPEPDGKLRIEEIFNKLQNPICLFEVKGKLEAFIKAFLELNLFITSIRFNFTLLELELLNFSGKCDPPKPKLADLDGSGNLRLNIGPRSGLRNVAPDTTKEEVTVRPVDNQGTYSVSAFGVYQTYGPKGEFSGPAVVKVIGDGAGDDDKLQMLAGADQEAVPKNPADGGTVEPASIPFTAAVELIGGDGNDVLVGGDADDTLFGGNGDDRIEGGKGNDTLHGEAGVDTLNGGEGNDTLHGGTEGDNLQGGPGHDEAYGGPGNDLIQGGPGTGTGSTDGNDLLVGNEGADVIEGGTGNDRLYGDNFLADVEDDAVCDSSDNSYNPADPAEAADKLTGGPGNDVVVGGAGPDEMFGGGGHDRMCGNQGNDIMDGDQGTDVPAPGAPAAEQPGNDVVRGGPGSDRITGNLGHDLVHGGLHRDHVDGGPGNDDVVGGGGRDFLVGGSGLDIIVGDDADIDQGAANNKAARTVPIATSLVTNIGTGSGGTATCAFVVDDTDTGTADCIQGGDDPDLIFGEGGNDQIFAGTGNDVVYAGDGDDNPVRGEAGDDTMFGEDGEDTMFGDSGADTMYGNADSDIMRGGIDADYMEGNGDSDTMYGEAAQDRIIGGSSTAGASDAGDVIDGGSAADVIAGDNATIADGATADDMLVTLLLDGEGAGDTISGDLGDDRIFGQVGADTIDAGSGADYVEGNEAGDTINGGDGADDLIGGSSAADGVIDDDRIGNGRPDAADTIDGGSGNDFIAGDNALVSRNVPAANRAPIELFDVGTTNSAAAAGTSGGDTVNGGLGNDQIFGQGGADILHGDEHNDYIEGNDGDDTIYGDDGDDDLVGGGSANDGVIDADRVGDTLLDVGETLISGGPGEDWMTGDNALIDRNIPIGAPAPIRLFDVETTSTSALPGTGGGEALMTGGDGPDWMFGQTGDDTMHGDAGADYIEGNNGDDTILGHDGDDDLVGGGSANDGLIDGDRVGDTLLDVGETLVSGGPGEDWITGDNALVNRNRPVPPSFNRAPIELFDVQTAGGPAIPSTVSGGDLLHGDDGRDRIFGQGNGAQPTTQTDPEDGRNNDFVGKDADSTDFDRATGLADEDAAGWLGDVILGGLGDDEIEGNHGNDLIFGDGTLGAGQDEDDISGGGSANDGKIWDNQRLGLGAALLDGHDTIHGDSGDDTVGDDDAVIGDNGWVRRLVTKQVGPGPGGETVDQFDRDVQMVQSNPAVGTYGNDHILGNGGHDELYGQAGHDAVEGGWGSDALVGDLGKVTTDLLGVGSDATCTPPRTIAPKEPFVTALVCQPGTLFRLVQLFAFDDTTATAVLGHDVMLGGDGDDWMHGGAGQDLMQGDGDGGAEVPHPTLPGVTIVEDPNPATADFDRIFGGDSNGAGTVDPVLGGNGDAIWGGRGDDHTYGGRGDDMLDVRPDGIFPATWAAWAEADIESYHGIDIVYGGYDQDAMQANVADNGPVNGDRMLDWVGVYNITYLCPATYGAYVTIRDQSPHLIDYLLEQAATDGALTPHVLASSGGNEVAMVYKPDVKDNANPTYPGTPGHFFCTGN